MPRERGGVLGRLGTDLSRLTRFSSPARFIDFARTPTIMPSDDGGEGRMTAARRLVQSARTPKTCRLRRGLPSAMVSPGVFARSARLIGARVVLMPHFRRHRLLRAGLVVAIVSVTSSSCGGGGSATTSSQLAVRPVCTILCQGFLRNGPVDNGLVFVSERTAATPDSHFTPLRPVSGPVGNPADSGIPPAYAVSEVWERFPLSPVVYRAFATDGPPRTGGSTWGIQAQDATGAWSGIFGTGSANNGSERDFPEVGALYVPQLMTVGVADPQVFACAGSRTEDDRARTTRLIEVSGPNAGRVAPGTTSGTYQISGVQDLLNGDRFFTASGPLASPTPPTPAVYGPGDPTGTGAVQCAMRQFEDDLATRELHMIVIKQGHLYHSLASDWGTATRGDGTTFSRFRAASGWTDVEQALGQNFGTITSAAIVAYPSAISVFFVAQSGGRYRVWHTVRYSASGLWRPARDVLALSGDAPNGTTDGVNVSAGVCPTSAATVWDAASTETLLAIWPVPNPNQVTPDQVNVLRVVSTAQEWRPGVTGFYSPMQQVPRGSTDAKEFVLQSVVVSARPFADDGTPFP